MGDGESGRAPFLHPSFGIIKEPGFEVLLERLAGADSPAIGAPTMVEAAIVVSSRMKQDARALTLS
jgi:uncharacterized protein with PIN domain